MSTAIYRLSPEERVRRASHFVRCPVLLTVLADPAYPDGKHEQFLGLLVAVAKSLNNGTVKDIVVVEEFGGKATYWASLASVVSIQPRG